MLSQVKLYSLVPLHIDDYHFENYFKRSDLRAGLTITQMRSRNVFCVQVSTLLQSYDNVQFSKPCSWVL